jgi:hypothetical protein
METDFRQNDLEADRDAEEWFRKGMVFHDKESLEQAYACFRHGIEISPNHSMLQFALGQAFDLGIGVEKDDSQAVEWYQKSAEQGLIGAMFFLAQKYEFGQGIQSDPEQAMRWYRNAAEGGLPEAQFALGEHCLCDEVEPLTKHWEEAASWFRKAAEQGHSNAQLRLAGMYEDGLGIPKDLGAAGYWFCKAVDGAQETGKGVPAPWSIKPEDAFEKWIASQVSPQEVNAREPAYSDGVEECGICGCNLNYRGLYVNGRLRGDLMWSNMCTECLKGAGEGIGCDKGQLYARQPNGDWRLVAGWCPEQDERPPSD